MRIGQIFGAIANTAKSLLSNPLGTAARLATPGGALQLAGQGIANILQAARQPDEAPGTHS